MTIATTDYKNGVTFTGGGNGETVVFTLLGGKYLYGATATFNAGNIALTVLGPDNSTYFAVSVPYAIGTAATFSAAGTLALDLCPGTYKITITTASAVLGFLLPVPYSKTA